MTLPELERNVVAILGLAIIAGHEDERFAELGGSAVVLLTRIEEAGGLEELVMRCMAQGTTARRSAGG